MYKFTFVLTDEDYFEFNKHQVLTSPSGKKNLAAYRLLLPLVMFIILLGFVVAKADTTLIVIELIWIVIMSILWLIFSKTLYMRALKKRIGALAKEGRLPYDKETTLTFDDEIMTEVTPEKETKTKYSMIERITTTDKAIYIHLGSVQAYIIPLKVFSDAAEIDRFIQFIKTKMSETSVK